jgi:hypothetical protein
VTAAARVEAPVRPGMVHIDVAEVLERATRHARPAMDEQLLEQARRCAAGAENQPPRRELVAVVLREVAREQRIRGEAEASLLVSNETRRDLLLIVSELVGFVATQLHIDPDPRMVLQRIRAMRPSSVERAIAVGVDGPTDRARVTEAVARG